VLIKKIRVETSNEIFNQAIGVSLVAKSISVCRMRRTILCVTC